MATRDNKTELTTVMELRQPLPLHTLVAEQSGMGMVELDPDGNNGGAKGMVKGELNPDGD
uniref:DUF834 domain-containing protein n=1 Tax=Oryza barthii TaxID=65489 RepID=A0A0D3ERG0_9ORYZ